MHKAASYADSRSPGPSSRCTSMACRMMCSLNRFSSSISSLCLCGSVANPVLNQVLGLLCGHAAEAQGREPPGEGDLLAGPRRALIQRALPVAAADDARVGVDGARRRGPLGEVAGHVLAAERAGVARVRAARALA